MAWNWYTKGRRIPTLIGKDVSGRRIPGGPYTGLQAVTVAAVPAVLWWTRGLWAAEMAGLAMFAVLVGATVAAVKLVGKVDFASRNPVLLLGGYLRQIGRPMSGTLAGRRLVEPKPHRVAGSIDVTFASFDEPADTAGPQPPGPASAVSDGDPESATRQASADLACAYQAPAVALPAGRSGPPAHVGTPLQPATTLAPDRRRSGLEAFLSAARETPNEQDAA